MITADNLSLPHTLKRRQRSHRRSFWRIYVRGHARHAVGAELPSPFRTVSTTRSHVISRTVSTTNSDQAPHSSNKCFRASWKGAIRLSSHSRKKSALSRRAFYREKSSTSPSRPTDRFGRSFRVISRSLK